jgi:hypothetical protein
MKSLKATLRRMVWLLVLPVGPLLFGLLRYVSTYTMGF